MPNPHTTPRPPKRTPVLPLKGFEAVLEVLHVGELVRALVAGGAELQVVAGLVHDLQHLVLCRVVWDWGIGVDEALTSKPTRTEEAYTHGLHKARPYPHPEDARALTQTCASVSYLALNSPARGTCWIWKLVSAKESVRARYLPCALSPVVVIVW